MSPDVQYDPSQHEPTSSIERNENSDASFVLGLSADAWQMPTGPLISYQQLTGPEMTEAGPLPEKVGEIGYIHPPSELTTSDATPTDSPADTFVAVHSTAPPNSQASRYPGSPDSASLTEGSSASSNNRGRFRGRRRQPGETLSATKMFIKPVLLVSSVLVALCVTSVVFIHAQQRIASAKNGTNNDANNYLPLTPSESSPTLPSDIRDGNPTLNTTGTGKNDVSSVYVNIIFVVILLVEFWLLFGALRNLYHHLGTWVDQEYHVLLPDLSDPDATPPAPPILPWWAKLLQIKPEAVRPPLLPQYAAVLNAIRVGGRAGVGPQGTGDAEDGEVIRTLAIGQGQAAPAFDGEEFQKSTVLLGGPAKRDSLPSPMAQRASVRLMRTLSRSLPWRFSGHSHVEPIQDVENSSAQRDGGPRSEVFSSIKDHVSQRYSEMENFPRPPPPAHDPTLLSLQAVAFDTDHAR